MAYFSGFFLLYLTLSLTFNTVAQDTAGSFEPAVVPFDTSVKRSGLPAGDAIPNDTNLPAVIQPSTTSPTDTQGTAITPANNKSIISDSVPLPKSKLIDARFAKYKVLHSADSIYFNVLKVKNNKEEEIIFTPKISLPDGWKQLFFSSRQTRLKPGDSVYFPIRSILPRTVKGGVTYILSASLMPEKGFPLERAYAYISIPKITMWKVSAPRQIIYLSSELEYEKFEVMIQNSGNSDEKIKLDMTIGNELEIYGAKNGYYSSIVNVPSGSDTVLIFSVRHRQMKEDEPRFATGWKGTSIRIKAASVENEMATTLWFQYLEHSFTNVKGTGETPLNFMFAARNILAKFRPIFYGSAWGTLLFCNRRDLKYSIYNYALGLPVDTTVSFGMYLLRTTFFQVSYNTPKYQIMAGDISGFNYGVSGKGIAGTYKFKSQDISASIARNLYYPLFTGSLAHTIRLARIIPQLSTVLSYGDDRYNKINYYSGTTNLGFGLAKGHSVGLYLGGSTKYHYYDNQTFSFNNAVDLPTSRLYGFTTGGTYTGQVRKLDINLNGRYSSKSFAPIYNRLFELSSSISYPFSPKYSGRFRYSRSGSDPWQYIQGRRINENSYLFQTVALNLEARVSQKVTFSGGPLLEQSNYSRYNGLLDTTAFFSTLSERIGFRMNYRSDKYSSVTPFINAGFTKVIDYNDSLYNFYSLYDKALQLSPYFNVSTGVSVRKKYWGVNIYYYYGPYSVYSQQAYFYGGNFHKSIRIIPYFEKYFFNRRLRLHSYNSYFYDVGPNVERINLSVHLDYFFNKGWTIFANNSISLYSRYDDEGEKFNSRSYYMDFGVKKNFNIQQPCIKFYNLTVTCFNDLNGNRLMDENEKGMEYIMGKFILIHPSDSVTVNEDAGRRFTSVEMITDRYGEMKYLNIPQGNYELQIEPLVNLGDLFPVLGEKIPFTVSDHTNLFIPFSIANKINGKVILVRDPFSVEGSLSSEGIRVTAQDSLGYKFHALSDKSGNFNLQVPKSGMYRITVSNPFGENFILEQDEFLVDFNGFKEFEVNFKFMEKKRPININGVRKTTGSVFDGRDLLGATETVQPPVTTTTTATTQPQPAIQPGISTPVTTTQPATATTTPSTTPATATAQPPVQPRTLPPNTSPDAINAPQVTEETVPTKAVKEAPSIKFDETKYYIVLGSFSNKTNAEKMYNKLSDKTNAVLIVDKKGLYKVIKAFRTLDETLAELEKSKSVFPAAWISKKMAP